MEFLRGAIAIVLCWSMCFPALLAVAQEASAPNAASSAAANIPSSPSRPRRSEYDSGQLRGDARILHALNRLTFGPRPGDMEAVRELGTDKTGPNNTGLDKWFDQQLHPENIDETDLDARLAQFPAMQWSTQDLLYRMPSQAMIRQAADGKINIPPTGTLHVVYENQIYRYQMRKAAQADKQANAAANPNTASQEQNQAQNPGPAPVGGAQQPDMSATTAPETNAGQAMNAETAMTSMTPSTPALESGRPPADPALIANILSLPPTDRVRRLQAMQPEEFDGFMKSLRPVQRAALVAGMTPDVKESLEDLAAPEQTVVRELMAERLTRDIYSNAQLEEVMTDFWLNHFNVYLRKNEQMPYYLVSYARDVIRPHAMGKFEDLLEAVAHSPAMMIYLDNAQSVGPDSVAAYRAKMVNERAAQRQKASARGIERKLCARADGTAHGGRNWRLHAGRRHPSCAGADGLDRRSAAVRRRISVQRESP